MISEERATGQHTLRKPPKGLAQASGKSYKCVHNSTHQPTMKTLKVGIREFRDRLASYLLETDVPVAITRHGDTVGYYIPARRKRAESDRTALKEAAACLQQMLSAEGISEEEILKDFKRWRAGRRK
jgi:PHD/YefM family antitoxin component YafN of YafNO toxin-antitoxin module